jgi:hypothetical protein
MYSQSYPLKISGATDDLLYVFRRGNTRGGTKGSLISIESEAKQCDREENNREPYKDKGFRKYFADR